MIFYFVWSVSAGTFKDLMGDIFDSEVKNPYCQNDECGLDQGINIAKAGINDIEKERSASEYAQDIVKYILSFITVIAVIYIIYAGFNILTWAGDEEKQKKSKDIIVYVLVWILVIWLSFPIVSWLIKMVLAGAPTTGG